MNQSNVPPSEADTECRTDRYQRLLHAEALCGRAVVREWDEVTLFREVCRIVVEEAGFSFAWIGVARHDARRTVDSVARHGSGGDVLDSVFISWDDGEFGRGPSGTAIRDGQPTIINDYSLIDLPKPWADVRARMGIRSLLAIPLTHDGGMFGVLHVYADRVDAFLEDEQTFFTNIAASVSYGVSNMRSRRADKTTRARLEFSLSNVESLVAERTHAIEDANVRLKREIDERRRVEERLRESELLYRSIFEVNAAIKLLINAETGKIVEANPAAVEFYGYSKQELLEKRIYDLNTRPREEVMASVSRMVAAGRTSFQLTHRLKNGEVRDIETYTGLTVIDGVDHYFSIIHDRTDDVRARRALEETFTLLDVTLDSMPGYVAVLDSNFRIIKTNAAFSADFPEGDGFVSVEACTGESDCIHCLLGSVVENRAAGTVFTGIDVNGVHRTFKVHATPVIVEHGHVQRLLVSGFDVTDIKDAEIRLEELVRKRTSELAEAHASTLKANRMIEAGQIIAGLGTFEIDLGTGSTAYSKSLASLYGLGDRAMVMDRNESYLLILPEERKRMVGWFEQVVRGSREEITHRIIRPDGTEKRLRSWASVLKDENGVPVKVIGASHDVTRLYEIADAYAANEQMFDALINSTHEHIYICERDGRIAFCNARALGAIPMSPDKAIGTNVWEIAGENRRSIVKGAFMETIMTKNSVRMSALYEDQHYDVIYFPILDDAGEVVRVGISSRNVTDIMNARTELEKQFTFVDALLQSIPVGIYVIEQSGRIERVNRYGSEHFGYADTELVGKHIGEVLPGEESDFHTLSTLSYLGYSGVKEGREWQLLRADGSYCDVMLKVRGVERERQVQANMLIIAVTDISEIRQLEKEKRMQQGMIIQQAKLAAMGEMVGAIAHQWKQPLNSMSIIVQYLRELFEDGNLTGEEMNEQVERIMTGIRFMSNTVDTFRNFFKPSKEIKLFEPASAVRIAMSIIEDQFRLWNIFIEVVDETPETMQVSGFVNEFKQVVLNLLVNARDAIADKKREPGTRDFIHIHVSTDHGLCEITVTDSGTGIPESVMQTLFDAYHTTKGDPGTGIGLYMSKMIVERMNGTIAASNVDGGGARFTIRLPVASS